jgi:hypothetical protein
MLQDKTAKIKFTVHGQPDEIEMTITGDQLTETMKRRMKTLMPTARITDISEITPDSQHLDLNQKPKK